MRELVASVAAELDVPTATLVAALPLLDDPRVVELIERQVAALTAAIGTRGDVPWPEQYENDESFQLLAILATVPATRRWYVDHGVSAEVADDSLADITVKLRDYGVAATGADWFVQIITANVFTLGRLQFEPGATVEGSNTPAWSVHIPELGPLDPAACDASFAAAAPFFAATIGDEATRTFVCHSWLLDDQLALSLPTESNILRFQRRFNLVDNDETDAVVDGITDGDTAVAKFIFRRPLAEVPTITPSSRLEKAVIDHLAAGGHWRERTGTFGF